MVPLELLITSNNKAAPLLKGVDCSKFLKSYMLSTASFCKPNFNMKQFILLFALSLGFYFAQAQEKATDITVDQILATYFENTGGVDNWKALTSTRMEGKMVQMGMEFPGVVTSAAPNKQRVDVNVQGQEIIQAYDGKDAWWINPFTGSTDAQPMPPEMAESMTKEVFESVLIDYAEKGHAVTYLGHQEVDGTDCYEVKVVKKDGDEQFYYFETENVVPIMMKTIASSGPAKGQATETFMSDYEEVNGLVIPMYIDTKVNGASQFSITITKVEFNVPVSEELFAYPKAAATGEDKK